jgi:hypothetical protein
MTALGLATWLLVGTGIVAAAWGVAQRRHRGRVLAAVGIIATVIIGLVIVMFAGMGAFCVAPPGAACM